eukprot:gene13815-4745_t
MEYHFNPYDCNWLPLNGFLFQLANLMLCLTYVVPDTLNGLFMLRFFLGSAGLFFTLWAWWNICAPDTLAWNVVFMIGNFVHALYMFIHIKRPRKFLEHVETVYEKFFKPMGIQRFQFQVLADNCSVRTLKDGKVYGAIGEKAERISILLQGRVEVKNENCAVHITEPYEFLDSPEWASSKQDELAEFAMSEEAATRGISSSRCAPADFAPPLESRKSPRWLTFDATKVSMDPSFTRGSENRIAADTFITPHGETSPKKLGYSHRVQEQTKKHRWGNFTWSPVREKMKILPKVYFCQSIDEKETDINERNWIVRKGTDEEVSGDEANFGGVILNENFLGKHCQKGRPDVVRFFDQVPEVPDIPWPPTVEASCLILERDNYTKNSLGRNGSIVWSDLRYPEVITKLLIDLNEENEAEDNTEEDKEVERDVTLVAHGDILFVEWKFEVLNKLLKKDKFLRTVFNSIICQDVTKKLMSLTKRTGFSHDPVGSVLYLHQVHLEKSASASNGPENGVIEFSAEKDPAVPKFGDDYMVLRRSCATQDTDSLFENCLTPSAQAHDNTPLLRQSRTEFTSIGVGIHKAVKLFSTPHHEEIPLIDDFIESRLDSHNDTDIDRETVI